MLGHGRLGARQVRAGFGETVVVDHGDKGAQEFKVEGRHGHFQGRFYIKDVKLNITDIYAFLKIIFAWVNK